MRQPFIIVGAGTEVVNRILLPTCQGLRDMSGRWPEHVFALVADGDEATRSRYTAAHLPSDRAAFIPLSMASVREALAWRKAEFSDCWREGFDDLVARGPDNGACMVPAIGRMMMKAARPAVLQHLEAIRRRLAPKDCKEPEVFVVLSPVSGTSRGSVVDLPRYVRAVFPDAHIHAVVLHPVGIADMDAASARVFQTNFIEALRLIDRDTTEHLYRVWLDDAVGWQEVTTRVIDSVFAFDGRYGNLRRSHLSDPARTLPGRLGAVCERAVDFLVGTLGGDPLYERTRARLADAELHRSEQYIDGHRTYVHAIHEVRASLDLNVLRRALVERALERVGSRLATGRSVAGLTVSSPVFEAPEASA